MGTSLRYSKAKRVTLFGALANFLLSLFKITFGWIGSSQALFADGIHSFSDLLIDLFVLFTSKISHKSPDELHPYGHGRVETLGTVVVSLVLIFVALGIVWDAIYSIWHQVISPVSISVLVVASVAIVVNELLFRYTLLVANRIDSNLLKANAWHKRSDAWSSIVVLMGISAERMGVPHFDAVAAIVVAIMIMYQGVKWIWRSVQELIDVGVQPDFLAEIKETILNVDGVNAVHGLRTRRSGSEIYLEAHVQVDEKTSASEGHFIADWVQRAVIRKFPKIVDVTVHIDVVDDLYVHEGIMLPSRSELIQALEPDWKKLPSYPHLRATVLHYLGNEIAIELVFPLTILNNLQEVTTILNQYKKSIQAFQYIRSIHIFFVAD